MAFGLGALAGAIPGAAIGFWLLRRQRLGARADAGHQGAFEQWPTGALVLNTATLQIVAANPAALRSLGYTLAEVRELRFGDLFSAERVDAQALVGKLLDATSRIPVEMRQRCKDGSQRNVEANCYRLTLGAEQVLGVLVNDITLRRKAETQLLERHQHLDHLAHHDQLTGLPNRLYLAAHLPGDIEEAKQGGSVLAVSQFTLYGDVRRGRCPSFDAAAPPEQARHLYEFFVERIRATGLRCETGRFQEMMEVQSINEGPVTILLDSGKDF